MADRERLVAALHEAHRRAEAGDEEAAAHARHLATVLQQMGAQEPAATPAEPPAQEQAPQQPSGPWDNFLRGFDRVKLTANRINPMTRQSTPPVAVRTGPGGRQEAITPIGLGEGVRAALTGNEAAVRSGTSPMGGDFLFGAAQAMVNGDFSAEGLQEGVKQQRERRAELEAINPAAAFVGEAAGYMNLYNLATRAAPQLAARAAQPVMNTARGIVAGGGTSAAGTLAQGGTSEEAGVAGATDAALTGALGVVGRVGAPIARAAAVAAEGVPVVRSIPAIRRGAEGSAIRALANRTGMNVEDLQAGVAEFRMLNNRPPALAELDDPEMGEMLVALGRTRRTVRPLIDQYTEALQHNRPAEARDAILAGRESLTAGQAGARVTAQMNATMGPIRNGAVSIPHDAAVQHIRTFQRAGLGPRLPNETNAALARATADDAPLDLTVGQADDIARQLRNAATVLRRDGPSELANQYDAAAAAFARDIGAQNPAYLRAYDSYAIGMDFVDGLGAGAKAIGTGGRGARAAVEQANLETAGRLNAPAQGAAARRVGLSDGARQEVAANIEGGTADVISEGRRLPAEGRQRELSALVGPQEAARIGGIGNTQARAAEAIEAIRRRALDPNNSLNRRDVQDAIEVSLLGFRPNVIGTARTAGFSIDFLRRQGVPPNTARRIAEFALDPERADEAVQLMERARMNDQQITEFLSTLAGGLAAADMREEQADE